MARPTKIKTKQIQFEKETMISISELKLDYDNIRLVHTDVKSFDEIKKALWTPLKLSLLSEDILQRGLQDPLELYPNSKIVAEGNCRLLCLKELFNQNKIGPKIKCKRIVTKTPIADIEAYLAGIHVGQKAEWPEFNQAKLLHTLYHKRGLSYEEITQIVRKTRRTVNEKITAFELTFKHKQELGDDWHKKFVYVWEFIRNKNLENFRSSDKNVKRFMNWVKTKKINNSKQIRILDRILENQKTKTLFETKDYDSAFSALVIIDPTISNRSDKKVAEVIDVLLSLKRKDVKNIAENSARVKILKNLKKTVDNLLEEIKDV